MIFCETVMAVKLEAMGSPTGEAQMMNFPVGMGEYRAGDALTKSPHVGPSVVGQVIRSTFSIGEFGWICLCQVAEGNMLF